jgi:hypothetical protein
MKRPQGNKGGVDDVIKMHQEIWLPKGGKRNEKARWKEYAT